MTERIRVAVAGANGRMGTIACEALQRSGEFCCGLARTADPQRGVFSSLEEVIAAGPDVLLDLTTQPASFEISLATVSRGVPAVVGASGWNESERDALAEAARRHDVGAMIVPNFSLGATL